MKKIQICITLLALFASAATAGINLVFSEIAETGNTRLTVSGDGILSGLSTSPQGSPGTSNTSTQDISADAGTTDNFDITDQQISGSFQVYPTVLTAGPSTLAADFVTSDIDFSFSAGTVVNLTSNFLGIFSTNLTPGLDDSLFVTTDGSGATFSTITLNSNYTLDSPTPFSNFTSFGSASWSTPGSDLITISVVPEPGSFALIAGILGAVSIALRRRVMRA